jgi:hypothetical protein
VRRVRDEVPADRFEPTCVRDVSHDEQHGSVAADRLGGAAQPSGRRARLDLHADRFGRGARPANGSLQLDREQGLDIAGSAVQVLGHGGVREGQATSAIEQEHPFLHRPQDQSAYLHEVGLRADR